MRSPENSNLLKYLGKEEYPSEVTLTDAKEFIRLIFYGGKVKETYTDTRINKYKSLVTKTSASIPPDQDSVKQVILRAHLQIFKWKRCIHVQMKILPYKVYGWKWDSEEQMVVPVWSVGHQFPEYLRSKKVIAKAIPVEELDADDESEKQYTPVTKKRKITRHGPRKASKNIIKEHVDLPEIVSGIACTSDTTIDEGYLAETDLVSTGDISDGYTGMSTDEEEWEVADFSSSGDSSDEWTPGK